jgi:hypothetical protein
MKSIAIAFGIVFFLVGLAGFVPALCPEGYLFGLFAVNALHNMIHVATGVVAICAGALGFSAAQNFFRVFGMVYALVAAYGFMVGNGLLLNLVANNIADAVLHSVIAVFALFMGFGYGRSAPPSRPGAYA